MDRVETTAQDPEEPFEIVTAAGRATGQIKPRAEVHRDGDWHRALHVWIAGRDSGGEPFLIFQRRGSQKDTWPDHFDATVGGHVRAGESLAETLREVEEEIGIPVEGLTLLPLGRRLCANEAMDGIIDREVQDVFLLVDDRLLTEYRPNPAELAALVRFPLAALIAFLVGQETSLQGESLAAGGETTELVSVGIDDFIPTVDNYSLRIAIAAENVLRGDRYVMV
jgi:isopentenyldiphosphate isomerase